MYLIQITLHINYTVETGNNFSEFTHLKCYSSPKHESLLPNYYIHSSQIVHSNLNDPTFLVEVQITNDMTRQAIHICHAHKNRPDRFELV